MKQAVFFFLLINILACTIKEDKITFPFIGNELLTVADGGSLNDFTELIRKAKFHITDSSWGRFSGMEYVGYSSEDSLTPPNILEVHINKDSAVRYMYLKIKSKDDFLLLKEDFINAGFKVLKQGYGIEEFRKENSPIDIMMMGFEKTSKSFRIFLKKNN